MKRFSEMSVEELAALSEETLKTLVDLELAHAGILPASPPQIVPLPSVEIEATEEAFVIDGNIFKNESDAKAFQAMPRFNETYDYPNGYEYKYLAPISDTEGISTRRFYVKEKLNKVQLILRDRTRIKNQNDNAQKEYDKFVKDTSAIRDEVHNAYGDACDTIRKAERAKEVYEKHLTLADGNVEIAKKFFRDAYKFDPKTIARVLHEEVPEEATKA